MQTKRKNTQRGITLIALVITIIVMLILVAVTINMAINGGLFGHAKEAKEETKNAIDAEQELANGRIKVAGVWYDSMQDYVDGKPSADQGGTGDTPTEQTHTWDKLSFTMTYATAIPNESTVTWPSGNKTYTGCRENINYNTQIVRYPGVSFSNNNSFALLGTPWTGNYKDYIDGQYKNYPYGIIDHYSVGCCCTYYINNVRGLLRFENIGNRTCGATITRTICNI